MLADAHKPEIVFISNDASETGAPRSLVTFVEWLVSSKLATARIVLAGPGPLEPIFEALCPVYRTWCGDDALTRGLIRTARAISWNLQQSACLAALSRARRHWRPSLVYANTATTGREMAVLSRPDVPVVTHVRELDRVLTAISQTDNLTTTLRLTNRFIANSNATKDSLVRGYRVPPEKVDVVYPFVATATDASGAKPDLSARIRHDLGLRPHDKLVVGCGTVHARKGTDLFIEVAGAVVSRRTTRDVRFVWVGGDTTELTREAMQKCVAERGLSDVVSFIGHRTDYIDFLAAADVLLLTSREEPFGRVILEAALFATPTICFAGSGGAPEFIRNDAGRVVERENVNAMAVAATELLDSAPLSESLGARARERVLHEHSIEVGAPRIWGIVERTIEEHALRQGRPPRAD